MLETMRSLMLTPGEGFMPHGMCLSWQPGALWLNVGADAMIVTAYLSIPFILLSFVRQRSDLAFRGAIRLFALFIFFCALTHAFSIWVIWYPDFIVQGALKIVAGVVSLATAVVLWRLIPKALAIPNPAELAEANAKLAEANATLETRVTDRTKELEETRALLQSVIDAMPIEMHHFDKDRKLRSWNAPLADQFKEDTGLTLEAGMDYETIYRARMKAHGADALAIDAAWSERLAEYDQTPVRELNVQGRDMLVRRTIIPDGGVVTAAMNVTRLKITERRLAAQTKELERSNKELAQFAHIASHDLQEPPRTITSYMKLLQENCHGQLDDQARLFMHFASDGAARMQQLIKDLLAYSRAGAGAAQRSSVALYSLLEDIERDLEKPLTDAKIIIQAEQLPTVMANRSSLKQLLSNLIGNAVKYRRQDASIVKVSAEREQGAWTISVEDNGIGIAPQYQAQIFEMFKRLHLRDEYAGAGIGLAICQRIVESFGGRIWVESTEGVGSTFHFTLPDDPGESHEDTDRYGKTIGNQPNTRFAG